MKKKPVSTLFISVFFANQKKMSWIFIRVQVYTKRWTKSCLFAILYSWCPNYGSHLTILLIFFLFVWIYISKGLVLRYLYVILFYKFDYLEQYLRELFNMASGFHFGTKSSTSGSHTFICLHYWIEVSRLFSYHL